MTAAMDLNASPLPEDDEETFEGYSAPEYSAPQEHVESAVDIARRVLLFFFFSSDSLNPCSWSFWSCYRL